LKIIKIQLIDRIAVTYYPSIVLNEDGTFKSAAELSQFYRSKNVLPENEVITYCRIGERSSHSWFVLTYLLGYPDVKKYDGSWTE
jgi:thiosulfate/3-mercaptopyruvate sulfurtransferase